MKRRRAAGLSARPHRRSGHVPIARPAVEAGLLKRLGKPPFERKAGEITDLLVPVYAAVSDHALRLAVGEDQE